MTTAQALDVTARSVSHREAEVFLGHVLGIERSSIVAHPEKNLTTQQEEAFLLCLQRRENNEPVAYITGHKEFYGREFATDARALIPRPETEGLIDRALEWLPGHFTSHLAKTNKPCPLAILEIGTGCGNIAITLALELAQRSVPATILATDVSPPALEVARQNGKQLAADSLPLVHLSWLEANMFTNSAIFKAAPYDLIIANLPYVPTSWRFDPAAQPEVVFMEPEIALFGGADGLDLYRIFFAQAAQYLATDGRILIEYGEDETGDITPLAFTAFPNRTIETFKDYAGLDRVLQVS